MAIIRNATIGDIIYYVARLNRVDTLTCEACAFHESIFNWLAVGDNDTSFGLYQLHEGGELGNLTKEQAMNPLTNCERAIPVIAAVQHQHPDWSPGLVAATAQRPANPSIYAADVNQIYNQVVAGKPPINYLTARNKHTSISIPA